LPAALRPSSPVSQDSDGAITIEKPDEDGDAQCRFSISVTAVLSIILISLPDGGAQYHFGISQISGRNYLGFEREAALCRAATA
jgi:hypothetical protein